MAKEKAKGGTEVVDLFSGEALGLGISGGEGPGVLAVEDEGLAPGDGVRPAHTTGFAEEEDPGLGSVQTHAVVGLGEGGTEGAEVIVVCVDGAEGGQVGRGELWVLRGKVGYEQESQCEVSTGSRLWEGGVGHWIGCVQLVAPWGSCRIVLFSSEQKPRSPVLPIDWGTAVISNEVYIS